MKRNNAFIKRKIGTQYVIVATGAATKHFNGMISVNSTGSFIWDALENEVSLNDLVAAITDAYEIDAETAKTHAEAFLKTLKEVGAVEG